MKVQWERRKTMKHFIVGALVLLLSVGCARQGKWTAFVFPDENEIPSAGEVQNFTIGTFGSFQQCQEAAIERIRFMNAESEKLARYSNDEDAIILRAAYECGFKCTPRKNLGGLLVCKETRK